MRRRRSALVRMLSRRVGSGVCSMARASFLLEKMNTSTQFGKMEVMSCKNFAAEGPVRRGRFSAGSTPQNLGQPRSVAAPSWRLLLQVDGQRLKGATIFERLKFQSLEWIVLYRRRAPLPPRFLRDSEN